MSTTRTVTQEGEARHAREQLETLPAVARVVVVDENQLRASQLAAILKGGSALNVIVTAPTADAVAGGLFPADLVLLALGGTNLTALATGAEAVKRNPYAEIVFYGNDPDAPEVAAAGALGITRIVPAPYMASWLGRAGELLARGAFLRRAAGMAFAAAPPPPTLCAFRDHPPGLPLPTAEMQFRESYIRSLLAHSGSRQDAAKRAGVPYRTMCEMIRKLAID